MLDLQSKNITKAILTLFLITVLGEGVLGLGLFWPFLLILSNWSGVYWLAVVLGLLISSLYKISIGLPSVFLVIVVALVSLIFGPKRETGLVVLVVSILASFVFDLIFGLPWGVGDLIGVVFSWVLAMRRSEKGEAIKLSY